MLADAHRTHVLPVRATLEDNCENYVVPLEPFTLEACN